jgi:hypothetical protein
MYSGISFPQVIPLVIVCSEPFETTFGHTSEAMYYSDLVTAMM